MKSNGYYNTLQNLTENFVNIFLLNKGFKSFRNNLENITDVDLIVNSKKVDVQFSQNFSKYGDIRIDVISAAQVGRNAHSHPYKFLNEIEKRRNIKVLKAGKYFNEGYADYVIYLLYNNKISGVNSINLPDYILLLNVDEILYYINLYAEKLAERVIINDKTSNGIYEEHISAFLPMNLDKLKNMLNNFSLYKRYNNEFKLCSTKDFKDFL